jgi:predicted PurR-regulated permease PerM
VLALLVAVFDLIPLVGATIGAIVVVAVAFTQGVTEGVVMLIFSLVYQQIENQIIQPIVMKRSVSVSPFLVLTSVLIGSSLLGVIGALLAIPFAGSIQIALREVLEARRSQVQGARDALATAERAPPVEVDLALESGLPPPGHAGDPPPLR